MAKTTQIGKNLVCAKKVAPTQKEAMHCSMAKEHKLKIAKQYIVGGQKLKTYYGKSIRKICHVRRIYLRNKLTCYLKDNKTTLRHHALFHGNLAKNGNSSNTVQCKEKQH